MNTTDLEIKIPAAIADLPLAIGEKIVLAHIHKFAGCSNARLSKLIGGTCRGVENMLRRLRKEGYIEQSGKGRARRHQLLFPVEHHTLGGDGERITSVTKSHTSCGNQPGNGPSSQPTSKVAVLRQEPPLEEVYYSTLAMIQEMCLGNDVIPDTIV